MIGSIKPAYYDAILEMNTKFVHWLSPLDKSQLEDLLRQAAYARQIEDGRGVLIGLAGNADIEDHENLDWLKTRLANFLYIDRIIIASRGQGRGLGRKLYIDIEVFARAKGYDYLACEVNTKPDNPVSHVFHLNFGFKEIGEQSDQAKLKAVRYYAKAL